MATEVLMPKLGLTMTEGTIEAWKRREGDAVQKGDVLFSVATDKLTNDVECEADGVLLKILLPEGETAPCKSIVAWIGQPGEAVPGCEAPAVCDSAKAVPTPRAPDAYVSATPYAKKLARERGRDLADICGTGPNGTVVARDVERCQAAPKTSPMAAKLAAELGVDVASLDVQGRVMKIDVLNAAGKAADAAQAPSARSAPPASGSNDLPPVKVAPLRRSIAANMTTSWATSPRVTYTHPVDATAMKALRSDLQGSLQKQGIRLTYNHILMKVVSAALTEFPDINASFSDNMLTRHIHVNMGLAVAKDGGLIVPNVKCCEEKGLAEIARDTERLIGAARSGRLDRADMTGGTFTISSLGPYGITAFSPIINQPELAILGVCDMVDTPVARNGELVIRPMMNLCLTADHRVIDGVMAARFLQRVCQLLENPLLLLV